MSKAIAAPMLKKYMQKHQLLVMFQVILQTIAILHQEVETWRHSFNLSKSISNVQMFKF